MSLGNEFHNVDLYIEEVNSSKQVAVIISNKPQQLGSEAFFLLVT